MSVVKFGWVTYFYRLFDFRNTDALPFLKGRLPMAHRRWARKTMAPANVKRISLFRARAGVDDVCHDDDALQIK